MTEKNRNDKPPRAFRETIIIGLMYLRLINAAYDRRRQAFIQEGTGQEDNPDSYRKAGTCYVPEAARWAVISDAAYTPKIREVIYHALRAMEAEDRSAKKAHVSAAFGYRRLESETLSDLVAIFTPLTKEDAGPGQASMEAFLEMLAEPKDRAQRYWQIPVEVLIAVAKSYPLAAFISEPGTGHFLPHLFSSSEEIMRISTNPYDNEIGVSQGSIWVTTESHKTWPSKILEKILSHFR